MTKLFDYIRTAVGERAWQAFHPVRDGRHPGRALRPLHFIALLFTLASPAAAQTQFPQTLPANTVFGRTGIGAGPGQAIPFSILTGGLLQAITGDLTCVISGACTISPAAVINSKLANMPANTFKGNNTSSPATPSDLTVAQVQSEVKGIAVSVTDPAYGAACNGSTNDFTAIQNAINGNSGGRIFIPPGTCTVTLPSATSLATPGANTIIEGAGKNNSILQLSLTGTSFANAFPLSNSHIIFRNLTIKLLGDGTGTQQGALFILQASDLKFQNVALVSNAVEGVLIGGTATNLDTVKVIFTSSALAGSPITITSTVTTGQTTAQIASGLATAINANGTISGAGIVATANGSFVSISQPDTMLPQASYTTSVTGAATETMTIGPSATTEVWLVNAGGVESDDLLAENADVSGWNYVLLKTGPTTSTNRRFTFRGGFYNQNISGHLNINSPSATFDRLVIEGVTMGSVGLNSANDLPIALSNVSNASIIGNVLVGTYDANAIHIEENSLGVVIQGNTIQQATSASLGTGFSGTCIFAVDNNVGGAGFRSVNDVTISGNACHQGNANVSGYGIFAAFTSTVHQRWSITGNTFTGYAGGANLNIAGFTLAGNTFAANSAAGTGIVIAGSSSGGAISDNIIRTYTTDTTFTGISGITGLQGQWIPYTPAPSCGTATFTTNSARSKTAGKTTIAEIDVTFTALGTCTNNLSFTLPNTANSAGSISGRDSASTAGAVACLAASASATASCAGTANFTGTSRVVASGVYENQ